MGITASWLAVQGQDREVYLERLGLTKVGECSDPLNSEYTCAELPNGWFVVVANARQFELIPALKSVSAKDFVLGGQMVETVNFCQLCGYEGGAQVWSVVHDVDIDLDGVQVAGDPPSAFAELHAQVTKELEEGSRDVDYMFDLPLELSGAVCGFQPYEFEFFEWTQLVRKDQLSKRGPVSPVSLRAEMNRELTPFMQARGWEEDTRFDPHFGIPFRRTIGKDICSIEFMYASHPEPWILVRTETQNLTNEEFGGSTWGEEDAHRHIPFWKRLLGLEKPPPPPPTQELIVVQIEKAKKLVAKFEALMESR